jgi:hypothetical protein
MFPNSLQALPTYREAIRRSVAFLAAETVAKSVDTLCLRADGEVWLIRVGRRGGVKRLKNLGNPLADRGARTH